MVPREQGIEGWLWTSTGGSALTILGDEDAAPNAALLFTKPLGPEQLEPAMDAEALDALAARSPLGVPTDPRRALPLRRARQRRDRVPHLRPAAAR